MRTSSPRSGSRSGLGPGASVVTLLCDSGLKYLSTDVYREEVSHVAGDAGIIGAMSGTGDSLLDAWRINDRVTALLVGSLSPGLWTASLPDAPRRTVRSLAAHLHNSRRLWMKSLAAGTGIALPARVDPGEVTRAALRTALDESGGRILLMLGAGLRNGGTFPGVSSAFYFGAMPRDVALFVGYALSHESHHRGQLVMAARVLGQRLPAKVTTGLWQWSSRLRESRAAAGKA